MSNNTFTGVRALDVPKLLPALRYCHIERMPIGKAAFTIFDRKLSWSAL